jgi:hypothetical protein
VLIQTPVRSFADEMLLLQLNQVDGKIAVSFILFVVFAVVYRFCLCLFVVVVVVVVYR